MAITASGQDFFIYLVGGTPFGNTPVLANFTLTATSTQNGSCQTNTCGTGDSFSEQGFTGSFTYTVATGGFAGNSLLAGTFSVNATPTNSGATFASTVGGTGGATSGTQTLSNPTGILMTSDFLNFAGVNTETGSWAFSSLIPAFAVNPPDAAGNSKPLTGQPFTASSVGTFSSQPAPTAIVGPEPATMALLGLALVGLGFFRRKRLAR